jgi:biopolymer transport protein ExbD
MRKCSQTTHQALTELNTTPLLDLGFVLLVIFIITTTPIVMDQDVNLPDAGQHPREAPRKANYITIRPDGGVLFNNRTVDLGSLQALLADMRQADPDLSVIVRGDAKTPYRQVRAVLEACQQANVLKVDLATQSGPKS